MRQFFVNQIKFTRKVFLESLLLKLTLGTSDEINKIIKLEITISAGCDLWCEIMRRLNPLHVTSQLFRLKIAHLKITKCKLLTVQVLFGTSLLWLHFASLLKGLMFRLVGFFTSLEAG